MFPGLFRLMPVLHHYPLSAGSRFVRVLFSEFGENPTLVEEQPWERSEALLKLNPAGTRAGPDR